jgi:hypothetical protein
MALMLGRLYNALISAGADETRAREASEEVAAYKNRLVHVESDLTLLKWMVGFNLAMTIAILLRLFLHG